MKILNSLAVPEIGDHLAGHFGYEAHIVEAYVVMAVTKTMVVLQRVAMNNVYQQGGLDWTSTANWECPVGEVVKKKFKSTANGYSVKISSYQTADTTDRNSWECYNHH